MQRNYPEEILSKIFKDISFTDLLTCHYVCRSWYFSAQAKLLKAVKLNSNRAIEQFVAAFDHKRSPAHLSAVNSLTISLQGSQNEQPKPLNKETVEILLLRFPNLVNVELDVEMIKDFNEELSKKILLCCPNLDRFDISFWYGKDAFFNELVKVRSLLTNMQLMEFSPEDGDPEDFITQFPRMQYILSEGAEIDSIYKLLSILEKLSLVNRLYLTIAEDIENNFGEEYLARQENELMRKRLSNITKLTLRASRDISNTHICAEILD